MRKLSRSSNIYQRIVDAAWDLTNYYVIINDPDYKIYKTLRSIKDELLTTNRARELWETVKKDALYAEGRIVEINDTVYLFKDREEYISYVKANYSEI